MFVGLGLWGIVPIVHQTLLNARESGLVQRAIGLDLLMGGIYLVSSECLP